MQLYDVILRKSSETNRMCMRCPQQDVQYQKTLQKLNDKCDRLNRRNVKLRAEVTMLRRWAQLRKLTPPSPPATPPPKHNRSKSCNYAQEKEQPQHPKSDNENTSGVVDVIQTDAGVFVDSLEIGEEIKRRMPFAFLLPNFRVTQYYAYIFRRSSWPIRCWRQ